MAYQAAPAADLTGHAIPDALEHKALHRVFRYAVMGQALHLKAKWRSRKWRSPGKW
jgi:hypothetical protein